MNPTPHPAAWKQGLHKAWQQRSARERLWLLTASVLLTLLALWQVAIAPAWSVWREAPARQARIDTQTRQMLQWQAQAQGLQPVARMDRREALTRLQAAADALLGPGARVQPQGEQVQVTLQATPAEALAQWLALARNEALAQAVQAQLEQVQAQRPEVTSPPAAATWQGTLMMRLP